MEVEDVAQSAITIAGHMVQELTQVINATHQQTDINGMLLLQTRWEEITKDVGIDGVGQR